MSEQKVHLKNPIKYHLKGVEVEATFVDIKSPTTKQIHLTSVLKQAFQVAANKVSKENKQTENANVKEEEKDDSGFSANEVMSLIYMGGDEIKIKNIMLTGVELLTCGIVLLDGEEKLTKPICDKLSQDDFEEILGSILVNFILVSLLDTKN